MADYANSTTLEIRLSENFLDSPWVACSRANALVEEHILRWLATVYQATTP